MNQIQKTLASQKTYDAQLGLWTGSALVQAITSPISALTLFIMSWVLRYEIQWNLDKKKQQFSIKLKNVTSKELAI